MIIALIVILVLFTLYALSTTCRGGKSRMETLYGWKYAHRGLHGDGVPENSLEAFRRACDKGYGSELDVHLLADGNLAVIHDSVLKRTTGLDGRIEDLTTTQLQSCFLDGTNYTIPEFGKVLEIYAGKAPLIVELKAVGGNYKQLCEKTCAILDDYNGLYCLESFDPRCVYWLRKNRPDLIRGQLTENFFKSKSSTLPWVVKLIMTTQMLNFLTRPDFVAYKFRDRKQFSNFFVEKIWKVPSVTWTLVNEEEYKEAISENRIPIFESFEP